MNDAPSLHCSFITDEDAAFEYQLTASIDADVIADANLEAVETPEWMVSASDDNRHAG